MRRPLLALAVVASLLTATGVSLAAAPASVPPVVPATPATAPFVSPNVTPIGTVPLDGVGVSMETRTVNGQVRAYVSAAGGLSIYDATDPRAPELLGRLPFYNWENEDIAVSEDGSTAFLTEFEGTLYLDVVDVSDPTLPVLTGVLPAAGAHTVVCADKPCDYLYGSEGQIFDVRDRTAPVEVAKGWGTQVGVPNGGHNLHQDGQGLWTSDTSPLVVFKQGRRTDGSVDPLTVTKVTDGKITLNSNYQHNNIRPNAEKYVPRAAGDTSTELRDGELLLANGESNFTGTCNGDSGSFSTWSMVDFDKKKTGGMKQIDVLRPVNGTYANGDPAVNALGCSGHWFTEKDSADGKDILVAAAWYEHGTRFLKVNKRTGKIRQVGFFQPVRGSASEAFFMPTKDGSNVVWTIDYQAGLNILEFDEGAKEPTVAQTDASWLSKVGVTDPLSQSLRALCRGGLDDAERERTTTQMRRATLATFPKLAVLTK